MNLKEKLLFIQTNLVAQKTQYNSFGKYKYRSLEDIYEALKPLLEETKTVLTIDDDIELIGTTLFRKSTAYLIDTESKEDSFIKAVTFTQEAINKKGMSPEQCSGSTASYGNKYVLNKLFCIDDTKDADATNIGTGMFSEKE